MRDEASVQSAPDRLRRGAFARQSLSAAMPMACWALHFFFCYIFLAVACDAGLQQRVIGGLSMLRWGLLGATSLAVAAVSWSLWRALRGHRCGRDGSLYSRVCVGSALLALAGMLWLSVPLLSSMPSCLFA